MLAERRQTEELMDDPALPVETYNALISDLARVNRLTLAYRPTLAFLAKALAGRDSFSMLDVGYGQGDMLRAIAAWAARNGKRARLFGVDLNPSSLPAARKATLASAPITYVTGHYRDIEGPFDVIASSLVAHHMAGAQLRDFLRFMDAHAQRGWFVNDLHRHTLSYLGWPVLARLMGWHPIVCSDGHTSIARSFRPGDWATILEQAGIAGAQVARWFPFRLCVGKIR